ncbi:ankyrin repeat domain-containing protein [Brachyspira pilosicoli]|uniref:ankyrin repeat domain-containing protein n=1 Tax=Brachyspira pilosicoli TaxID=52584 RepID=UPI0012F49A35|nr:ankyrin repeat domain-containing protein [Brachyspira pilosicoli]
MRNTLLLLIIFFTLFSSNLYNITADEQGFLFWASYAHMERVKDYVYNKKVHINVQDNNGNTVLMRIASLKVITKENMQVAEFLIDMKADLNVVNNDRHTALVLAINNNNTEIAKLFVEKGAKLDIADRNGYTALMWAVENNNAEMVKLLINKRANVFLKTKDGDTAYSIAKTKGNSLIIRMLEIAEAS